MIIRISPTTFKTMFEDRNYYTLYYGLLPLAKGESPDVLTFDIDRLGEAFRLQWADWARTHQDKILEAPAAAPPAPAAPAPILNDSLARLQREQREAEAETAQLQSDAATKRAAWYLSDQGLLDNDYNRDLFFGWFDRNKAAFTSANVDICIQQLSSELQWAVWSPRVAPVVTVRMLENGEPELPIDCSEQEMRRASKAQLQDLSLRRGEGRQSRGWSGSKFIESTMN